jgi:hypothetical protein
MSGVEEMAAGANGHLGYAVWIRAGEVTVEGVMSRVRSRFA